MPADFVTHIGLSNKVESARAEARKAHPKHTNWREFGPFDTARDAVEATRRLAKLYPKHKYLQSLIYDNINGPFHAYQYDIAG